MATPTFKLGNSPETLLTFLTNVDEFFLKRLKLIIDQAIP